MMPNIRSLLGWNSSLALSTCVATVFKLPRFGFHESDLPEIEFTAWRGALISPAKELFDLVEMDWDQLEEILLQTKLRFMAQFWKP